MRFWIWVGIFLSCMSAQAEISFGNFVEPFLVDYKNLKDKSLANRRTFILAHEFLYQNELGATYYRSQSLARRASDLSYLNSYAKDLPNLVKIYPQKVDEIKLVADEVNKKFKDFFGQELKVKIFLFSAIASTDANIAGPETGNVFSLNLRLVSQYNKDELKIVLAHELFHVLQKKLQEGEPEPQAIEGLLFSEGWGTYVSSLIFPGKPDWKYVAPFKKDDEQYKIMEEQRHDNIIALLTDWEAKDKIKNAKYFSGDPDNTRPFEPRSGYYLGYLMAKKLAEKTSPKEVAMMKFSQFKKILRETLESLK